MSSKVCLTFDCEDFINVRSMHVLYRILQLLQAYNIQGLFFLTGHIAERIINFPMIVDMLKSHQIGYHSSAHSVHPTIVEYTDVKDYTLARKVSLERETSHINPLTGECEGRGGITFLRELFPEKQVTSFRAPGFCWSPPHLEALKELGIVFDFSTSLSATPVSYKGITFYPSPVLIDIVNPLRYRLIVGSLVRSGLAICDFHPSYVVNTGYWDSAYFSDNPKKLMHTKPRSWEDTKMVLRSFELFLRHFSLLQRKGILMLTPPLEESATELTPSSKHAMKCYQRSISWASNYFGYKPQFLGEHFKEFFNVDSEVK
jgi:hypothetical protein